MCCRPDTDADTRQAFIRDKYEHKRFCQFNQVCGTCNTTAVDARQTGGSREKALVDCVESDSLMETVELIAAGVQRDYVDGDTGHSILFLARCVVCVIDWSESARAAEQELQAELLRQNGFALLDAEVE